MRAVAHDWSGPANAAGWSGLLHGPGDFKKPLSLDLDRCSRLVFVQYRDDLEPWVAGTRAPDDLERYEEYHDFVPS